MNLDTIKSYVQIAFSYVGKILPIRKHRIYFCSFHGQYSDSPRRISETLQERVKDAELIWEISEKCREVIPECIVKVKPRTLRAIYYRSTSKVIVENYMGWSYGYVPRDSYQHKILSNQKKKNQFNICTWHGTALKRIGLDQPENTGKNLAFYSTADLLSANCTFMRDLYDHISQHCIPITMSGTPRNDILFSNDSTLKHNLRKKLGLPLDKKLILFAPTFRAGDLQMSGLYQIGNLDIEHLLHLLSNKFEGEWEFVFRAHDSIIQKIEEDSGTSPKILSGNIGDDMGEYMAVCEILLTDYSSSFFDFMFTKKPCFLYCPDYDHYDKVERGFYFKPEELPYPVVYDEQGLYNAISSYDEMIMNDKVDSFLHKIGNVEDGKSTEKLVNIVLNKIG